MCYDTIMLLILKFSRKSSFFTCLIIIFSYCLFNWYILIILPTPKLNWEFRVIPSPRWVLWVLKQRLISRPIHFGEKKPFVKKSLRLINDLLSITSHLPHFIETELGFNFRAETKVLTGDSKSNEELWNFDIKFFFHCCSNLFQLKIAPSILYQRDFRKRRNKNSFCTGILLQDKKWNCLSRCQRD